MADVSQVNALTVANVAALVTVAGVGVNLIARMARTEMKVDLMWSDFRKRMPHARSGDDGEHA